MIGHALFPLPIQAGKQGIFDIQIFIDAVFGPLPPDAGTLTVQITLHYQPLAHRSAMELFQVDTPAVRDFEFYWKHADRRPETIDTAETTVAE